MYLEEYTMPQPTPVYIGKTRFVFVNGEVSRLAYNALLAFFAKNYKFFGICQGDKVKRVTEFVFDHFPLSCRIDSGDGKIYADLVARYKATKPYGEWKSLDALVPQDDDDFGRNVAAAVAYERFPEIQAPGELSRTELLRLYVR